MTPDEVFAKLRDLHHPATGGASVPLLDPWPLLVFAGLVMVGLSLRTWLRRRQIQASLAGISRELPPPEQRDRIVGTLRGRFAPRRLDAAPKAVFLPPSQVTSEDVEELRRWVRRVGK